MLSPELINVYHGGESSFVVVDGDQPVLVEEHQVEAGGVANALVVVFPLRPFHVVRNLEDSQMFSGSSMEKKDFQ